MSDKPITPQQGKREEREPTPERQAQLSRAYEENVAAGKAAFDGLYLRNRAEVTWILEPTVSSDRLFGRYHAGSKPSLSGTSFLGVDYSEMDFREVTLRGAKLAGLNLSRSDFHRAELVGADLERANLRDANLENAWLSGANLRGADLRGTNLTGAMIDGTDLRDARMDNGTQLRDLKNESAARLGDIDWNGVSLTRVDWTKMLRLGDEDIIPETEANLKSNASAYQRMIEFQSKYPNEDYLYVELLDPRRERIAARRAVARAYRGLALALRGQGLLVPASGYRLREQRLERQVSWRERKYGSWLFSAILDLVAGYGERPGRIFAAYLAVISVFAAAYFVLGKATGLIPGPVDALVFSLTSFHGRGFFPNENIGLHHPLTILAALEAVVGMFIELILIATFSRRFLGN